MAVRAYALLLLTTLSWGANTIFGRAAVGHLSPLLLVFLRWLLVTAVLVSIGGRTLARDWPAMRSRLGFVAILGAIGFTGFNALYFTAAHTTTAVNMGIIQGAMPVLVLLGASAVDRAPVGVVRAVGVLLSLVGVVVVVTRGAPLTLLDGDVRVGDSYMLVAVALYAAYTIALRRRPAVAPLSLMTILSAAACLAALPLALFEAGQGRLVWPTTQGAIVLSLIVLFPSLLAQMSYIHAVGILGPARAGVFVNLVPVFASAMAVAILGEPFELHHGMGLFLVLGGIVLSERAGERAR